MKYTYDIVITLIATFEAMLIILIVKFLKWGRSSYYDMPDNNFLFYAIKTEIPGTFFSSLNYTNMTEVRFLDTDAAGKKVVATFTLPANAAGNVPTLKEGSLRAESTNPEVATAAVGNVNAEAGTYDLEINFTGKKGSADCKLIASPDLDNSGDPDIEGLVTAVITTAEASGFGEPTVSELQ